MDALTPASLSPPGLRSLVGSWEILRALIVKELKIKYKRSILGFLWSLINPVLLTVVYVFVFVHVYKVKTNEFILFLLSGMLPWQFFNMGLIAATSSLIDSAHLIRKVYFPRLLVPAATVGANLINFLMALGLLLIVVVVRGREVWLHLHWLMYAILLETALCLGLGLFLSVANVYVRDIKQIMSIMLTALFFATPIVYELDRVPAAFRPLIIANPLTSVMEIYRSALFYSSPPRLWVVALGTAEVAVALAFGYWVFSRQAPRLAKQV